MNKGYTVLELLVVIAIMGLLLGVGYANYRGYGQAQAIIAASRALRSDLRLAQEQATGGQKPAGCTGYLIGYKFTVTSATNYKIDANCSGGDVTVKNVNVDSSITLSAPTINPVLFKTLGQGTNLPNGYFVVVGITQNTTNNYASVVIASAGNVEESFATPNASYTPSPAPTAVAKVFVSRFHNGGGDYVYTTNQSQSGYVLDGIAFAAYPAATGNAKPVYGLSHNGVHFYTISESAKATFVGAGWVLEGVAFYAFPTLESGTSPVYGMTTPSGTYFYTISTSERDSAISQYGFTYQGIAFYAYFP